jgi:hypothetical protein
MVEHGDAVTNASPFTDQHRPRIGSPLRGTFPIDPSKAIENAVEDPLRGWPETTERPLLKPVRDGPDHQDSAKLRRRLSTQKRCPFLSQSWHVKIEKPRNFLSQLL